MTQKIYGRIWHRDDITKDPPVVRLMKPEDKPKQVWPNLKGLRSWDK